MAFYLFFVLVHSGSRRQKQFNNIGSQTKQFRIVKQKSEKKKKKSILVNLSKKFGRAIAYITSTYICITLYICK